MARAVTTASADEALPEADRLEGFLHPRETTTVYGHAPAETAFAQALTSGLLHHAWLLAGPEGIGKATLAYRFARAALADSDERDMLADPLDVSLESTTARQVAKLSHPGLLVLRRPYDIKSKKLASSIPIDDVRRLKSFLNLTAEAGRRRVIIVDSADDLNVSSANALLKSLEEPPERALFLILTSAPGRLLPTIRSRCRLLGLTGLDDAALQRATEAALSAAGKEPPQAKAWPEISRLSNGSVRTALACLEGGGLELQATIDKIIAGLPRLDSKAVHVLADRLQPAAAEQSFNLFLDLLQATLSRMARVAATGEGHAQDQALVKRLIDGEPGATQASPDRLASLAELWETLARDRAETAGLNLDRKALILRSFMRLDTVFG